jgi:hypothetical protein
MPLAHVSLEVEHHGPQGLRRKRMSLSLDLEEWPKRPGHPRRPLSESSKATPAVTEGAPNSGECFEDAVAELVQLGYGRERARHVIATRMKFPEHEIARLREAAS